MDTGVWAVVDHGAALGLIGLSLALFVRGLWAQQKGCATCPLARAAPAVRRVHPRLQLHHAQRP